MNNITTLTPEWLDKQIDDFRAIEKGLQSEIDCAVLDGTPYLLELVTPQDDGSSFRMAYGDLYPDQISTARTKGFRLQRRFDLCGCFLYCFKSAKESCIAMNNELAVTHAGQFRSPYCTITHRRDWFLSEIASLRKTVSYLVAAKEKVS